MGTGEKADGCGVDIRVPRAVGRSSLVAAAVVVRRVAGTVERYSTIVLLSLIVLLGAGGWIERRDRVATNSRNVKALQEQQKTIERTQSDIFTLIFRVDDLTDETHQALCGIKADYRKRAADIRKILRSMPGEDPVSVFGLTIPRSSLTIELRARRETLETLDVLRCPP